MIKKSIFIFICLISVGLSGITAQTRAKFIPGESSIIIRGTSNLHDWEEVVEDFKVDAEFKFSNKKLTGIEKLIFTCKSSAITSESSIMTDKTHEALKSGKHPDIRFTLQRVESLNQTGNSITGTILGDMAVAGVVRSISLPFKGTLIQNQLTVQGIRNLNMTDFRIAPPTAILGTLKTDENIQLDYKVTFQLD